MEGPTLEELSERNRALMPLDMYFYRRIKGEVAKTTLNLRRWFWALVERVGNLKGEVDEHGQRIKDLERRQRNMEIAIKALKRKKGREANR